MTHEGTTPKGKRKLIKSNKREPMKVFIKLIKPETQEEREEAHRRIIHFQDVMLSLCFELRD